MTDDRRILVVGGASGIGRAAAEAFIERGANVLVADRNGPALERLQPAPSSILTMDWTRRQDVREALARIRQTVGDLDAVVITAAVHSTYPVAELPDDLVDRVLNVNLAAHVKFVRDVLPLVCNGGRLVAVSSLSAEIGIPMQSIYSACKAGIELFYECLNGELRHRQIRCTLVRPGNVDTGFNETGNDYRGGGHPALDSMYERVVSAIHSRHGIARERVAKAIVNAVESQDPPMCVLVGPNARKAHWARRLLGRDLSLRVLAKVLQI